MNGSKSCQLGIVDLPRALRRVCPH